MVYSQGGFGQPWRTIQKQYSCPTVFVSHKSEDSLIAGRVAEKLWRPPRLASYIDLADKGLPDNKHDLGEHFRDRLRQCTNLMAVISQKTKGSWWVPFEIGIATELEYPLATYLVDVTEIPDYLKKWPYLTSDRDLDTYATTVEKQERQLLVEAAVSDFRKIDAPRRRTYVSRLHRALKDALGQI